MLASGLRDMSILINDEQKNEKGGEIKKNTFIYKGEGTQIVIVIVRYASDPFLELKVEDLVLSLFKNLFLLGQL